MADRARSPRPTLSTLATSQPSSTRSSPASPLLSAAPSFAFPSPAASSSVPASPQRIVPPSTSRFHQALTARPARHQPTASTSSDESAPDDGGPAFRFPPGSVSPTGTTSFQGLQREVTSDALAANGGRGFGFARDFSGARSREPSPQFGRSGGGGPGGARFFDEPEALDEGVGASWRDPRRAGRWDQHSLSADDFDSASDHHLGAHGIDHAAGSMGLIGRPASMDMSGDMEERGFDFVLSPPPPSTSIDQLGTARPSMQQQQQAYNQAQATPKGKERMVPVRERTFPAPLLLSRDRPFGGTSSPILGSTAPLSLPRKSSVSTGSTTASPSNSNTPPPSQGPPSRYPWAPGASTTPPPNSNDSPRSTPPYQRHRSQNSSQLSQSQSSITYTHTQSHSQNTSVGNETASPVMSNIATMGNLNLQSTSIPPLSTPTSSAPLQHATSASDTPLPPQALLLHILSLRAASQSMSLSQSATSQNHSRVRSGGSNASTEITNSLSDIRPPSPVRRDSEPVKLDTVDLSHRRIAEVSYEVINELKDEVEKLALGYNLLRELPGDFQVFSKLRYLNVRVNLLTTFPQVLCEMPSLEILDISRNKIKKLPTAPGTLIHLKVFSIAKNRVKRLPPYIAMMTHLRVLKIDHNPLEWPPKEITYFPVNAASAGGSTTGSVGGDGDARKLAKVEDADEMQRWLQTLTRWIKENAERRPIRSSLPAADPHSDEEDASRPAGMVRTESGRLLTSPPSNVNVARLRTTPPNGRSFIDEDPNLRVHSRNASHSNVLTSQEAEPRHTLRAKKSLPDLRQPHADILTERRTGPSPAEDEGRPRPAPATAAASVVRRFRQEKHPGIMHSQSARAVLTTQPVTDGPPAAASAAAQRVASRSNSPVGGVTPRSTTPQPKPLLAAINTNPQNGAKSNGGGSSARRAGTPTSAAGAAGSDSKSSGNLKRTDMERTPSGGFDRNSGAYFRRLSMLPASTISKTVPITLLEFADAIRGILFSLSQIYTALRQFVVFASQDRLPAPLARLMGSADGAMSLLINALDRFDSLSRRGTPSPVIVRDIFVTCHDNVVTFGRLVAALGPELKALVSTADVRYTRTLLLMLYGSTGEIANSWNKVAPLLNEMRDLSNDPSLATLILQPPTPSPELSSSLSSRSPANGMLRTRSKTRRHAGSFSVEDVQLGAVLPPAGDGDATATEDENGGGTLKARPVKATTPRGMSIKLPNSLAPRDMIVNAFEQPLTPGPSGLLFGEGSGDPSVSSPAVVGYLPQSAPAAGQAGGSVGSSFVPRSDPRPPPGPTSHADEQFLAMVDATTSVAYDVYGMLLESFDEAAAGREGEGASALLRELGPRRTKELTDLCILGNEVTTKLSGSWGRVRGIDKDAPLRFSAADARRLGEDSYTFVQTVIRFAKLVKAISLEHGFAPRVREGVGQLTISTRELAKHLSSTATSFRPSPPTSHANSTFPTR